MKVLYFAPAATPEDPSMCPFVTHRVLELQRQGHQVVVLQFGRLFLEDSAKAETGGFLRRIKRLCRSAIPGKRKTFDGEIGSFRYYDSLSFRSYADFGEWFRKNGFDLIHAHFLWFAKELPRLKKDLGVPYVVTVHGSDMHELTPYDKEAVDESLRILDNANASLFVSDFLLRHARSLGFSGANAKIVHNGVDLPRFSPLPPDSRESGRPLTLGFVGHPNFVKRPDVLPDVLRIVKRDFPSAKLLFVGSDYGNLLPYIKYKTWQLGLMDDVDFVPTVPPEQVGNYLRKMDVLLLPSRNEGFPCIALEAQACGIGVVGSANGGIPEAVGTNGVCVPESDSFVRDYAAAIVQWLKEEHSPEKIAAAVGGCSWENCVKEEIETYKAVKEQNRAENPL